jgi:nucleoside-diphosphate-sugar epimerase
MLILITGAETPLGQVAINALSGSHELRLAGSADLRKPDEVASLVQRVDAILHLAPSQPEPADDAAGVGDVLDHAARGTYVLLHAALEAGVRRVVLASRLSLLDSHPNAVIDETWEPLPGTDATSLAPYLAELTLREFVRAEEMIGICLRMGELGPEGTTPQDAATALTRALTMELGKHRYHWWLYHVESAGRYPSAAAAREPFCWTPAARS